MSFLDALLITLFVIGVALGVVAVVIIANFLGTVVGEWLETRGWF